MTETDPGPAPAPAKEKREEEQPAAVAPGPPPANAPAETLASSSSVSSPAAGKSFSQLLAGAMGSPAASPLVTLPVVAVPCVLAPASLLEPTGFAGQFTMSHQAVLATVTAQALMQLQAVYPSSAEAGTTSSSQSASLSPVPIQQRPSQLPESSLSTPEPLQSPSTDQKSQSDQIFVKSSNDGYSWRKYGQKQVKSSDRSRSYYKCTNVSCSAKKKIERRPDGRETEIIYRGLHNHEPPQKIKCSKEKVVQSSAPYGENEILDYSGGEVNESDPSISKMDQNSGIGTPERQLFCSSDCEGDTTVSAKGENADEPDPKKRQAVVLDPESYLSFVKNRLTETPSVTPPPVLKSIKEPKIAVDNKLTETHNVTPHATPVLKTIKDPKIVVHSASDSGNVSDGYRWRKYGQKLVKGNPNPRSYYRCTHNGCPVRKHVEISSNDSKSIVITYEGNHNHEQPAGKNGSEQPATALLVADPAAAPATKDDQQNPSDFVANKETPNPTSATTGDKTSETVGDMALVPAQTLLSIGLKSSSAEGTAETNSEGKNHPLFDKNCAAVSVRNS